MFLYHMSWGFRKPAASVYCALQFFLTKRERERERIGGRGKGGGRKRRVAASQEEKEPAGGAARGGHSYQQEHVHQDPAGG